MIRPQFNHLFHHISDGAIKDFAFNTTCGGEEEEWPAAAQMCVHHSLL